MARKRKPRVIHIHGRRWFERTNGNIYHTVEIWIDGEHIHKCEFEYGYESQYEWTAREWLAKNGYLPGIKDRESGGGEPLWNYCRGRGISFVNEVDDVPRRRDL